MQKRVMMTVIAAMSCLAGVRPVLAAKVQSGAMDICRFFDGGDYTVTADGTEVCCGKERQGDDEQGHGTGRFYCVECASAGSNDCTTWRSAGTPSDHINTILLEGIRAQQAGILVEQGGIRSDLNLVLAGLAKLEAKVDEVQDACTAPPRTGSSR